MDAIVISSGEFPEGQKVHALLTWLADTKSLSWIVLVLLSLYDITLHLSLKNS